MEQAQCQFYVLRKKRFCRMTVRPGKQYCGEHEPQPETDSQDDPRIPCPNDPKHTCFVSKLQKHLSVCNARPQIEPEYIERNVNVPPEPDTELRRRPLSEYTPQQVKDLITKVNRLFEEFVEGNIDTLPELPVHDAVKQEYLLAGRTESSLRHLRQVSNIMHLVEANELVCPDTCYVELGAGKGELSVLASRAWCGAGSGSRVLLVERAPLRHKRENAARARLPGGESPLRLRADLAHLQLQHVPAVQPAAALVGLAKHLCGVATDYALRCITSDSLSKTVGAVIATCCHHRCQLSAYVGELQELGITEEEFNIMLGIVSWATCGTGRPRKPPVTDEYSPEFKANFNKDDDGRGRDETIVLDAREKEAVGRRAKALLDWGRAAFLRRRGFRARLCHFVPRAVTPENLCIVATLP